VVVSFQGGKRLGRNLRIKPHLIEIIPRRQRGEQKRQDARARQKKCSMKKTPQQVPHQTVGLWSNLALTPIAQASNSRVVACSGARTILSGDPLSTMRPPCITTISSQIRAAIARS